MRIDWKNNPELVEKGLSHWLDIMERKLKGESISVVHSLVDFYEDLGYELTRGQSMGLTHSKNGLFIRHVRREYNIDINTRVRSWQKRELGEFVAFKQKLEGLMKYIKDKEGETMTFIDAAYRILKDNEAPMHYKDITEQARNKGYIEPEGKTPERSMNAMLSSEIQERGKKSRFVKVQRGVYGLSEWKIEPPRPDKGTTLPDKGITLEDLLFLVGDLEDGSEASSRFRKYLESRTDFDILNGYINEALEGKLKQSDRALQDLVNAVGTKLGFNVEYGRYRGTRSEEVIGYDGLWKSNEEKYIVIETRTTAAYQIDTSVIMNYIQQLVQKGTVIEEDTFGIYVIGRPDVSGLENNIKGAGRANKLRVISCDDLIELLRLKNEAKLSHEQILSLILPFDNVNIGGILEVIKAILSKESEEETNQTRK